MGKGGKFAIEKDRQTKCFKENDAEFGEWSFKIKKYRTTWAFPHKKIEWLSYDHDY